MRPLRVTAVVGAVLLAGAAVAGAVTWIAGGRTAETPAPVTLRFGYGPTPGAWVGLVGRVRPPVVVRDGTVTGPSPGAAALPGPLPSVLSVLPVLSAAVDPWTANRWARALRDAGVGSGRSWGSGEQARATLFVRLVDGRGTAEAAIEDFDPTVHAHPSGELERRHGVVAAVLNDIADLLQRNGAAPVLPLARYSAHTAPLTDYGLPVLDWPAGTLADGDAVEDQFTGGRRCRVLTAAESAAVRRAAADVRDPEVLWRTGTDTWLVVLRPLLPGETGCADTLSPSG